MKWYEILRLAIFILKLIGLLPKEKRPAAEKEALDAMAKITEEDNIA
ncbi:hypothetical protein LCGC14_1628780 [marine sediment metagenome]|uniref:Uncharacterized protein n=1 Tax=marine sediment metagenome TaxID=412755 RepID=A0A0F9KIY6_9ZZZZ